MASKTLLQLQLADNLLKLIVHQFSFEIAGKRPFNLWYFMFYHFLFALGVFPVSCKWKNHLFLWPTNRCIDTLLRDIWKPLLGAKYFWWFHNMCSRSIKHVARLLDLTNREKFKVVFPGSISNTCSNLNFQRNYLFRKTYLVENFVKMFYIFVVKQTKLSIGHFK